MEYLVAFIPAGTFVVGVLSLAAWFAYLTLRTSLGPDRAFIYLAVLSVTTVLFGATGPMEGWSNPTDADIHFALGLLVFWLLALFLWRWSLIPRALMFLAMAIGVGALAFLSIPTALATGGLFAGLMVTGTKERFVPIGMIVATVLVSTSVFLASLVGDLSSVSVLLAAVCVGAILISIAAGVGARWLVAYWPVFRPSSAPLETDVPRLSEVSLVAMSVVGCSVVFVFAYHGSWFEVGAGLVAAVLTLAFGMLLGAALYCLGGWFSRQVSLPIHSNVKVPGRVTLARAELRLRNWARTNWYLVISEGASPARTRQIAGKPISVSSGASWFVRIAERQAYWIHGAVFFVTAVCCYSIFVQFLPQHLDAQNYYYFSEKTPEWREHIFELLTPSALTAAGSHYWPKMHVLMPTSLFFEIELGPLARAILVQSTSALMVFGVVCYFLVTIGIRKRVVLGAGWFAAPLMTVFSLAYLSSPDNLQAIIFAFLTLTMLIHASERSGFGAAVSFVLYFVGFSLFVLVTPDWHLIALPFFGIMAAAIVLRPGVGFRRQIALVMLGLGSLSVHVFLGSYQSLALLVADSARVVLAEWYPEGGRHYYLAGYFYGQSLFELVFLGLAAVGLAAARLSDFSDQPAVAQAVQRGCQIFFGLTIVWGGLYYFTEVPAIGPKPRYLQQAGLPLIAFFSVVGLTFVARNWQLVSGGVRDALQSLNIFSFGFIVALWFGLAAFTLNHDLGVALAIVVAVVVGFELTRQDSLFRSHSIAAYGGLILTLAIACWGVARSPMQGLLVFVAIVSAVLLILLTRYQKTGLVFVGVVVATITAMNAWMAFGFGSGAEYSRDGAYRFGLVRNPAIDFLESQIGTRPGSQFRGLVSTHYPEYADPDLESRVSRVWADNAAEHGNAMILAGLNVFNIPTLAEYSPYGRALFTETFKHFLNDPTEVGGRNTTMTTRPHADFLRSWGVRYLLVDGYFDASWAKPVFEWNGFSVLEIDDANLVSFSPVRVKRTSSSTQTFAYMESDGFDPSEDVVLEADEVVPDALTGNARGSIEWRRGGFVLSAVTDGAALLLLPIQHTHCFSIDVIAGDPYARFIRANLAQTALFFESDVRIDVSMHRWPYNSTDCQWQDLKDMQRLLDSVGG